MTNKENFRTPVNPEIYKTTDPNFEPWVTWEEVMSYATLKRSERGNERRIVL